MATRSKASPIPQADAELYAAPQRGFVKTMHNALIIARREIRDSLRDWRIIVPIVTLTFVFPFIAQYVSSGFFNYLTDVGGAAPIVGERSIPFMLMVVGFFPISISLVIALETFVGEKERRSLEPLLSTPMTNSELYIGKTIAATLPPLLSSYGGMIFYLIAVLGGDVAWRPQPMLLVQIMLISTVQALVMVAGAVVVSSQATSTRAANLLASFIIVPMSLVVMAESWIMFNAPDAESPRGVAALWGIILGMAVVMVLLLRTGNSIFNREELLGRVIDSLNIRRALGRLWDGFRAMDADGTPAPTIRQWFTRAIPYTLWKVRWWILVVMIIYSAAIIGGYLYGQQIGIDSIEQARQITPGVMRNTEAALQVPPTFYFMQNLRILVGALFFSIISFGVAAPIMTLAAFAILGLLMSLFSQAGVDLTLIAAGVLPHGVVEFPVIVIAAAAAMRVGASITKIPAGMTVGQAWFDSLADSLRLFAGIVVPGLIISALLEAYLTPQVVLSVLQSMS